MQTGLVTASSNNNLDQHIYVLSSVPHEHNADCTCGHAHVPAARDLTANLTWSKAFSLAFAVGIGLIVAFAIWGRRWFLRRMDAELRARDAGDPGAVGRLRRLHWGGMLCNAVQLAVVVVSIPYLSVPPN